MFHKKMCNSLTWVLLTWDKTMDDKFMYIPNDDKQN